MKSNRGVASPGAALALAVLLPFTASTRLDASTEPLSPEPSQAQAQAPEKHKHEWKTGKLFAKDAGHVLSEPGRWKKKQWGEFGIAVGAIAATYTLDSTIRNAIQRNRGGAMDTTAHYLEPFGAAYSFGVIAAFYIGGVSAHDQNARETAVDAISATLIASGIITPALKIVAGRGRPSQYGDPSHFQPFSGDASFPSGHTTQAFVVASVIASHYDTGWVKGLSYGLAATVGFSRMVHDQHWASDVLTGALIGASVGKEVVHFNKTARLPKTARYSVVPWVDPRGYGATLVASF